MNANTKVPLATGVDLQRGKYERRSAGAGLRGRRDRVPPQPARAGLRAATPAYAAEAQCAGQTYTLCGTTFCVIT